VSNIGHVAFYTSSLSRKFQKASIFSHGSKGSAKINSPTKPPESSTMIQDEIQEIYNQMDKKITESREHIEKKMDENKKRNTKSIKEL
jgi:ClpP class serine protease